MTRKSQLVARKLIKNLIFFSISVNKSENYYFPLAEFNNSNEFL